MGELWDKPVPGNRTIFRDVSRVIEPPSKQLVETLLKLKLCETSDLRRCRHRVRRLARDLPAFDSVWIDALLQARRLTPFQAQLLESSHPEDLRVGPCVLMRQLGRGPRARTYLARQRDSREQCVLKLIDLPPEQKDAALDRIERLVARWIGFAHPHVVPPRGALIWNDHLVAVSRFVPGPHLGELLVRRGRFPAAVVLEMSKQLIDGLAALESRGNVHGDIRLGNVRLTSGGAAVLVDSGLSPAIAPELTIRADRSPVRYDGVAPELIGTGRHPDSASDIYALGCLLWQLLAGRPPFPTGDPLAKLAAHRTREIADVRDWAPDTPVELAQAVRAFTEHDPSRRPRSFQQIRERWKPPTRVGRRRLTRFAGRFRTVAQRPLVAAGDLSSARWTALLVLMFVVSGAALSLLDAGARTSILNIGDRAVRWIRQPASSSRAPAEGTVKKSNANGSRMRAIPAPDAEGLIRLDHDGPYEWGRIDTVGPLVIRGTPGHRPVIVIENTPCRFVAEQITLQNILFRYTGSTTNTLPTDPSSQPPVALVQLQSRSVTVRDCRFETQWTDVIATPGEKSDVADNRPAGIVWQRLDPAEQNGGRLVLRDTLFVGNSAAVSMVDPAERIDVNNCLKIGAGAFFDLRGAPRPGRILRTTISHLTLRRCGALMRIALPDRPSDAGEVHLDAADSVFDLARSRSALFQLVASRSPGRKVSVVELFADRCVAPSNLVPAAWIPLGRSASGLPGRMIALPPFAVEIDGLTAKPYRFAGPFSPKRSDARIVPNRNDPTQPGADIRRIR